MRLPRNPKQYRSTNSKGIEVSDKELHQLIWSLSNKAYRTLELKSHTNESTRVVKLPDGSRFHVYCGWICIWSSKNTPRFIKDCIVAKLPKW